MGQPHRNTLSDSSCHTLKTIEHARSKTTALCKSAFLPAGLQGIEVPLHSHCLWAASRSFQVLLNKAFNLLFAESQPNDGRV